MNGMRYESTMVQGKFVKTTVILKDVFVVIEDSTGFNAIALTPADARAMAADILAAADEVEGKPRIVLCEDNINAMNYNIGKLTERLDIAERNIRTGAEDDGEMLERVTNLEARLAALDDHSSEIQSRLIERQDRMDARVAAIDYRLAALEALAQPDDEAPELRCPVGGMKINAFRQEYSDEYYVTDENTACSFPAFMIQANDDDDARRRAAIILGQVKP